MAVTALDHLYVETTAWEASVRFWETLGFAFVERWGSEGHRAGRMTAGTAAIVLAEVTDSTPEFTAFFRLEDAHAFDGGAAVVAPLQPTHWGTRMARVRDPEGRVHALESDT